MIDSREHTTQRLRLREFTDYVQRLQQERDDLAYELGKALDVNGDLLDEIAELRRQLSGDEEAA